jgi:predicted ATPase
MMVRKIAFRNFKIFKEWQTLELRPITILIGKNNSGKSAIAKLPTLIDGSLSGKFNVPLKPQNEGIILGAAYEDLVYNKENIDNLEFELTSDIEKLKVIINSDYYSKKIFFTHYQSNETIIDVKKTKFKGFTIFKQSSALRLNYDYMGAFRETPRLYYAINNADEFDKIGIKGENAYPILIQWSESKNILFHKISDWYQHHFEGWKLKIIQIEGLSDTYSIALQYNSMQPMNLTHVGEGISQALPLVVRSFMPAEEEILIIVEEPETHLHPAAHGNLAQRFAESYLEDNHKRYLIETHSQNFVLRMRRLVAEGKLKTTDLAIYYVDFEAAQQASTLQLIEVDEDGEVEWWPSGVFNESLTDSKRFFRYRKRVS